MHKKLMFIANPRAGRGQIKAELFSLVELFTENGYDTTVFPTRDEYRIAQMIPEQAENFDLVVCSGGDGTLNEVIEAMMKSGVKKPLGYIPAGTTNDFAATLGLTGDMHKDALNVMGGTVFPCDIGSFNDRYFTYVAAFGAFTEVSYSTPQQAKNLLGRAAYILEGAKRLPTLQSYPMRIEADGRVIEDTFIYGAVTNSTHVAGFSANWAPGIRLDDGEFEALFIKFPSGPLALHSIATSLLKQKINERQMYFFRASQLRITPLSKTPWTLDGEYGGEPESILIQNHPRAIHFVIGPDKNIRALPGTR